MRYADTLLADGETVIVRRRQHWLALLVESRWGIGLWLFALVLLAVHYFLNLQGMASQVVGGAILVALLAGVVIVGVNYWQWWAQDYIVTNRRLMKVTGVFNKRSSDSSLEKINDIILDQSVLGRMMNFGDVDIMTASGDLAVDYFRMLAGPKDFKRAMLDQKFALESDFYGRQPAPPFRADASASPPAETAALAAEPAEPAEPAAGASRNGAADAPPVAAPAAERDDSLDVTRTLARLADLRDRGAITADEYDAKKQELLGRL
ncbi:MAG TPA: PH domain-containing protein [Candidatus Limnocylindria bacterium]|jgi:membrane protein YdbS with pleckstrin-like domain|nr:PH domain-containing protein [Candidatus Limnocylindria bacterium]